MPVTLTVLATAAGSDTALNPLFFVAGGLALLVVSLLGPLSRWSERRSGLRRAAAEATRSDLSVSPGSADNDASAPSSTPGPVVDPTGRSPLR